MKILITGALGYIGGECLLRFSQRPDITVYAIDNDCKAIADRGAFFQRYSNIHIVNCDITDIDQLRKVPQVDIVVHLAAKVGYVSSSSDPRATEQINVLGTANIASLYTPTIFFSTGSVYGRIGKVCDETVTPNPQTVYAQTKLLGEHALQNVEHVIFRPATAYGLSLKVRHDLIVHDLIQQIIKNSRVEIYQPTAMRSFYSVQKLAELVEYTCDHFDKFKNKVFNVGCDSGNVTKQQLVDLLKLHLEFEYATVDGADADTRDYNVDYSLLAQSWTHQNECFENNLISVIDYYSQWTK